tara:strand:+ start:523 stop:1404 length:882 start_codon:yes stop_codon:yes gene_type:complete
MSKRARHGIERCETAIDEQTLAMMKEGARGGDDRDAENADADQPKDRMAIVLQPTELTMQSSFASFSTWSSFNAVKQTLSLGANSTEETGYFFAKIDLAPLMERVCMKISSTNAKLTAQSIKAARQLSAASLSTASIDSMAEKSSVLNEDTETGRCVATAVGSAMSTALAMGTERYSMVGEDKDIVCTAVSRRTGSDVLSVVSFPAEDRSQKKTVQIKESDVVSRLLKLAEAREEDDLKEIVKSASATRDENCSEVDPWKLHVQRGDVSFVDVWVETSIEGAYARALRLLLPA